MNNMKTPFPFTLRVALLAVFAAFSLAGCATPPPVERPVPRYVYQQYPPTRVNVANIQVIEEYASPSDGVHAEQLMPDPLPRAVATWARNHFKTNDGANGTLTITIKDASVLKKDLEKSRGFKGAVTIEQTERYDARILVEFKVDGQGMGPDGTGIVQVTRGQTIGENASLQDRDRIWTTMAEAMMIDLDAGAQKMLNSKLSFLLGR